MPFLTIVQMPLPSFVKYDLHPGRVIRVFSMVSCSKITSMHLWLDTFYLHLDALYFRLDFLVCGSKLFDSFGSNNLNRE